MRPARWTLPPACTCMVATWLHVWSCDACSCCPEARCNTQVPCTPGNGHTECCLHGLHSISLGTFGLRTQLHMPLMPVSPTAHWSHAVLDMIAVTLCQAHTQHQTGLTCSCICAEHCVHGLQNINLGVFDSEEAAAHAYDAAAQQHGIQTGPVNFPSDPTNQGLGGSTGVAGSPGRASGYPRGGIRGSRGRGRGRGRGSWAGRGRVSSGTFKVCSAHLCSSSACRD